MKRIYFYLLTSLLVVSSCVKQIEEPADLPIAGKWAQVDTDGSVSKYISFEAGKYYEYETDSKHYYLNEKIWHANNDDYVQLFEAWYSARNGSLTYGSWVHDIAFSNGVLMIDNMTYLPLKSLEDEYGFTLTHDIPINTSNAVEYSAKAQEVIWNYQIEGLPKGNQLTVSANSTWIKSVSVTENQIMLTLDENSTMASRNVTVTLRHPAVADLQLTLIQGLSGPILSSGSTTATYSGGNFEVPYTIENPMDGVDLIAKSEVAWITDVLVKNDKLTFKIAENNSGASRDGNIVLTYGSVTLNHKVTQSYSAVEINCLPTSTSCSYARASTSFIYTVLNPREGLSVQVSCSEPWISGLVQNKIVYQIGGSGHVHEGTQVAFNVAENNSGASRTGNIVLTYGSVKFKHKVTQSYSAPKITCNPTSTSCDYVASAKTFTYTVSNPREGLSVQVSCSEPWIRDLVHEGTKVSFSVAENNSGASRTGNIVLTYGSVKLNHKVEQVSSKPPTDLSSSQTANCYIISDSGAYMFKTVKGNSLTSVGSVASASVLWESFGTATTPTMGDLIKSVSYKDGYITFQTPYTFNEGNAVIAAKDVSGNILWSWHIWLTDHPEEQVYYNNAGIMMDRNLGATSATPGDVGSLGLLYQWGRKDPFLGSLSVSSLTVAKSTITWPSAVLSDSSTGTVAYATANPTTFIKYNSNNYDWYYTGSSSTDDTRWTTSSSNKSIYDPCPAGWRVPDGGSNGVWSKALGISSSYTETYDSTYKGINFSGKFGDSPTIWYPASGYIGAGYGLLDYVGSYGKYWSASRYNNYGASVLNFYRDGNVELSDSSFFAGGNSVRCIQE